MHDLTTQPWMTYSEDLSVELQQCADEGKDIRRCLPSLR